MAKKDARKPGISAEPVTDLAENTYSTATTVMRDYNLRVLEIVQANSNAAFDFAKQLLLVKSPYEIVALWTAHVREQAGVMTQQTKELSTIGQKVANETAAPLAYGVKNAFKKAA